MEDAEEEIKIIKKEKETKKIVRALENLYYT
jgi:hypothetical protein